MKISDFDFELPQELIAGRPLTARDASRMLVVNKPTPDAAEGATNEVSVGGIQNKHVTDFISYLRPGDVVVFNNSRVIPARFDATNTAGNIFEITLHTSESKNIWLGLCKKSGKIKIGDWLKLDDGTEIEITNKSLDGDLTIKFNLKTDGDTIFSVLDRVGKMPLPPYMKRDDEAADRDRYQTVYAGPIGSMAAPTAGLHFTPEILDKIRNKGVDIINITLHVGAGTWMPIKTDDLSEHKMHSEWGEITPEQADKINVAKNRGGRVIAIGTTSLRLLESAAISSGILPPIVHLSQSDSQAKPTRNGESEKIAPFCGSTNIFITPGYKFKIVDILLTNFHTPKSTLFVLVSAFAGTTEMRAAYQYAIAEKYRFFSYGDCCLLFKSVI